MSRPLFDRNVRVAIDDLAFEDLRIDFDVKKTLKSGPNKAKIEVYNISRDRADMVKARGRDTLIRLEAGYGSTSRLIFQGAPTKGGVRINDGGVDRVLKIEAQDGLDEYKKSRIKESIQAGTPIEDAVQRLADNMELPVGKIEVPDTGSELTQGKTFRGRTADALQSLATTVGADFSIQDGRIQFIPKDATNGNTAPLISAENNNLLKSPSQKDNGIKLKALLNSTLNPGDRFRLESADDGPTGIYKARKIQYVGSLFETKFYLNIEATESPG
jgi:hypothetical protein